MRVVLNAPQEGQVTVDGFGPSFFARSAVGWAVKKKKILRQI